MCSRAHLTSWGEVSSIALVGHPSSDGVTIKTSYGIDVFHHQLRTPSFHIGLVKAEPGFIVRSLKTGLERCLLVVLAISIDAFLFLDFSGLTCHIEDTGIFLLRCFLVALYHLIVRRLNSEVATKRLLQQHVKILG